MRQMFGGSVIIRAGILGSILFTVCCISCGWDFTSGGVKDGEWYTPNVPDLVGNANFAPSNIPADWEFPFEIPDFATELPAPSLLMAAYSTELREENGWYDWKLVAGRHIITDGTRFRLVPPDDDWGYAILDFGQFTDNFSIHGLDLDIAVGHPRVHELGGWVGIADSNADYWKLKPYYIDLFRVNFEDDVALMDPVRSDGHVYLIMISKGWLDPEMLLGGADFIGPGY